MASPLVNTNRQAGVFPIMLQQFRRVIAITITRGNTYYKMGRLHYVRATQEQGKELVIASITGNNYTSGKGDYSWYTQHIAPGYNMFQQFKNRYDFCVH